MGSVRNLLKDLPEAAGEESFQILLATESMRIERIVSHGESSPPDFWYDQGMHEWVMVVSGSARIQFEGEEPIKLSPGSYVEIPAHVRHRVDWTDPTQPTVWLAIRHGP